MRRNPVIPYAIIAAGGILIMIVLSFIGVNQMEQIQQAAENGGEQQEESSGGGEEAAAEPEQIFENNCASCHGADLSGGAGPDLTQVGSRLEESEIHDIITNGTDGGMPPFGNQLAEEEINALAAWLAEQQ